MKVVVGLGNPGAKYQKTRHNVGFWVVEALSERLRVRGFDRVDDALEGRGEWAGEAMLLVKPQTYMNNSGQTVSRLVRTLRLVPEEILVVYDDLALEPGVLRMRAKGSAGGHNGIKSIINYLGTESFPRIRIGIGKVPEWMPGSEYVLSQPGPEESDLLARAVDLACEVSLSWIETGIDRTMSRYNAMGKQPK